MGWVNKTGYRINPSTGFNVPYTYWVWVADPKPAAKKSDPKKPAPNKDASDGADAQRRAEIARKAAAQKEMWAALKERSAEVRSQLAPRQTTPVAGSTLAQKRAEQATNARLAGQAAQYERQQKRIRDQASIDWAKKNPTLPKSGRILERLLKEARAAQKASGGHQFNRDYVDGLWTAYAEHVAQTSAQFKAKVDELNPYFTYKTNKNGNKVVDGYKSRSAYEKAQKILKDPAYKKLYHEYLRLNGDGDRTSPTKGQGSIYGADKTYGEIHQAQYDWIVEVAQQKYITAQNSVFKRAATARRHGENDRASSIINEWKTGTQYAYDFAVTQIDPAKTSQSGWDWNPKTKKWDPVYNTVEEEFDQRKAQYTAEMQRQYDMYLNDQKLQAQRQAQYDKEMRSPDGLKSQAMATEIAHASNVVNLSNPTKGPVSREEQQAVIDVAMATWSEKNRHWFFKKDGVTGSYQTGYGTTKEDQEWNRAFNEHKAALYAAMGSESPGALEIVTSLPIVKPALQVIGAAGSLPAVLARLEAASGGGLLTGGSGAGNTSKVGGVNPKIEQAPENVKAMMAEAVAKANLKPGVGVGNGYDQRRVAIEHQVYEDWLKTPEGQLWYQQRLVQNKKDASAEDMAFLEGVYNNEGDIWKTLDAIIKYGGEATNNDLANLIIAIGTDPTNAVPLKAPTWLGRIEHAVNATSEVKGMLGFKRVVKAASDWVKVTEPELRLQKEIAPYLRALKDGAKSETVTEMILTRLGGIAEGSARAKETEKLFKQFGINPRSASGHQLMSLVEETLVSKFKNAGIDYAGVAKRAAELETEKIAKEAADRLKVASNVAVSDAARGAAEATAKAAAEKGHEIVFGEKAALESALETRAARPVVVKSPLETIANDPLTRSAATDAHAPDILAAQAENPMRHTTETLLRSEASPRTMQNITGNRDVYTMHGVEWAPGEYTDNFMKSDEYKKLVEDLEAPRAQGRSHSPEESLNRKLTESLRAEAQVKLYNAGRESQAIRIRAQESLLIPGEKGTGLVGGRIPWNWKGSATGQRIARTLRGGRSSTRQYIASASDLSARMGVYSPVEEITLRADRELFEATKRRLVSLKGELERGKITAEQYAEKVQAQVGDLHLTRREADLSADIQAGLGGAFMSSELDHTLRELDIALGKQIINAAETPMGLKHLYETFSLIPGMMSGPGYGTALMKNILDPQWRMGLTQGQFGKIFRSRMFQGVPDVVTFREGGAHLFALFHLTLADGDLKLLKKYSRTVEARLLADPGNLYAQMWRVMETRAGVPWATKDFLEVETMFIEAAIEAKTLHPNFALAMIPFGPVARDLPITHGLSLRLRGLATSVNPHFPAAPLGLTQGKVIDRMTMIAGGALSTERAIATAVGNIHFIAQRFGSVMRRSQFEKVATDFSLDATFKTMKKGGPEADYAFQSLRADFIERTVGEGGARLIKDTERQITDIRRVLDEGRAGDQALSASERADLTTDLRKLETTLASHNALLDSGAHTRAGGRFDDAFTRMLDAGKKRRDFPPELRELYDEAYWAGRITHDNPGLHTEKFLHVMQDPGNLQRGDTWTKYAKVYFDHMVGAGAEVEARELLRQILEPEIMRHAMNGYTTQVADAATMAYRGAVDRVLKHTGIAQDPARVAAEVAEREKVVRELAEASVEEAKMRDEWILADSEAVALEGTVQRVDDIVAMYDNADLSRIAEDASHWSDNILAVNKESDALFAGGEEAIAKAQMDAGLRFYHQQLRKLGEHGLAVKALDALPADVARQVKLEIRRRAALNRINALLGEAMRRTMNMEAMPTEVGRQIEDLVEVLRGLPNGPAVINAWAERFSVDLYRSRLLDYLKHEEWFKYIEKKNPIQAANDAADALPAGSKERYLAEQKMVAENLRATDAKGGTRESGGAMKAAPADAAAPGYWTKVGDDLPTMSHEEIVAWGGDFHAATGPEFVEVYAASTDVDGLLLAGTFDPSVGKGLGTLKGEKPGTIFFTPEPRTAAGYAGWYAQTKRSAEGIGKASEFPAPDIGMVKVRLRRGTGTAEGIEVRVGPQDNLAENIQILGRYEPTPGAARTVPPNVVAPTSDALHGPRVDMATRALGMLKAMNEDDWLARELLKAQRARRVAPRHSPAYSAAVDRVRNVRKAQKVIEVARSGGKGTFIPPGARTTFAGRVVSVASPRARLAFAPKLFAPFVANGAAAYVEQGRTLYRMWKNTPVDDTLGSTRKVGEVSKHYAAHGVKMEEEFGRPISKKYLSKYGFPEDMLDELTATEIMTNLDEFSGALRDVRFADFINNTALRMQERLFEITGDRSYTMNKWLGDRLIQRADHMDARLYERLDREVQKAIVRARDGAERRTRVDLKRRPGLRGENPIVELIDQDIRAVIGKSKALAAAGVDPHAYNEARKVLRGAYRSRVNAHSLVAAASKKAADDLYAAGHKVDDADWEKVYQEAYSKEYLAAREIEAGKEADKLLYQLAADEMMGSSAEEIAREFERRYSLDSTPKGFEPAAITSFQKKTLEEAVKTHLGVTDLMDADQMTKALRAHGQAPPFENRAAMREWLTKYGFWSPRTAEAIEAGRRSWSIFDEAKYYTDNFGAPPDWANPDLLGEGGQLEHILYNERAYGDQNMVWGLFNRNMKARFETGKMTRAERARYMVEGNDALGLRAKRDLEMERKYVIERYGELVTDSNGNLTAFPWLMKKDELRNFVVTRTQKGLPVAEDLIQTAEELDIVIQLIEKYVGRYFDESILVGKTVTYEDLFLMAANITADMFDNPLWLGRTRDMVGDALRAQGSFRRMLVFSQIGFATTNVIDTGIKGPWTAFTTRSFRNVPTSGWAASQTLIDLGIDEGSQLLRNDARRGTKRLGSIRSDLRSGERKMHLDSLGNVVEEGADQRALRMGWDAILGVAELPAQAAGAAERFTKLRLAQGMLDGAVGKAMKSGIKDEELARAIAREFVGKEVSRMWPTVGDGPIERLFNEISPFMSYQFKNRTLFLGEIAGHPAIFNWFNRIGDYVEKQNRERWAREGKVPDEKNARLIELPWAEGVFIDFTTWSDASRGVKPLYTAAEGKVNVANFLSQFVRLVGPNDLNMAYGIFNSFDMFPRYGWVQGRDADGFPNGVWSRVQIPWEAPWGDEANVWNSFWPVEWWRSFEKAQGSKWDVADVTQLVYQIGFFGGLKRGDKGAGLNSYYFTLKEKDAAAAKEWLDTTPDGVALKAWWLDRATQPDQFYVPASVRDILNPPKIDPSAMFHSMPDEWQAKVKQGWDDLDAIGKKWDQVIWGLPTGSPELREAQLQFQTERYTYYHEHPWMFEAQSMYRTPEEWAKELDRMQLDSLRQDYYDMEATRPERKDFKTAMEWQKAKVKWDKQRAAMLKAFPQLAEDLGKSRNSVEAVWKAQEEEWFNVLDRVGVRSVALEAAKQSKDYDVAEQIYLINELDYATLNADTIVTYFDPTRDFATLPEGLQGPAQLKKDPTGQYILPRSRLLPDFNSWRYARMNDTEKAKYERDQKYVKGMAQAIGHAKEGGGFDAGKFVNYMKRHPALLEQYFKNNPGKRHEWAVSEQYYNAISKYGILAKQGKFAEAGRYFDNLPDWVKARYYEKHPERKAAAQESMVYMNYMEKWVAHYKRRDYAGGAAYFDKLPKWVQDRYYAKHPKGSTGNGSSAYSRAMGKWVKLLQSGKKDEAKAYFDSMPKAYRDRYYSNHPEAALRDDIKRSGQLSEYFSADDAMRAVYLKENPGFAKWLAKQSGSDSTRRMLIMAGYQAIDPSNQWLKRVYREKYPEVFSVEAKGEASLKRTYAALSEHPDMLPGFEKWLAAIWASYAENLKHSGTPPKPITSDHSLQSRPGLNRKIGPHRGQSAAWVRIHQVD